MSVWNHRSSLSRLLIAVCLLAIPTEGIAFAQDDPFVGYWRNTQYKSVYQITREANGNYRMVYGWDQAGVWGWGDGKKSGDALEGTWKNRESEGGLAISPWKTRRGQPGLLINFKSDDRRYAGKVYVELVDRDPSKTPHFISKEDQAWRYAVIKKYADRAQQEKMDSDEWSQLCGQIRGDINRAGKWNKGWFLPSHFRQIGWSDWEIGWLEIYFLQATTTWNVREHKAPESKLVHHRFHSPADIPSAAYHTRALTSYREANKNLLKQFNRNMNGRASVGGPRLVKVHYAMWDYLTSNESCGVIARPVFGDFKKGEAPRVALYNDSHKTVRGSYAIEAYDADRKLAHARGKIEIPPYKEKLVDLETINAYAFFHWRLKLNFVPEGYEAKPIAKDTLKPFHEMADEYAAISQQKDARLDFLDATLCAGVKQAWDSNDHDRYARAVRDAGGRLYTFYGKEAAVREFVRKQVEAIEQPDAAAKTPMPGLPTGETELSVTYDPKGATYTSVVLREVGRLDPVAIAAPETVIDPEKLRGMQGRVQAINPEQLKPKTVKLKAHLDGGYLYLNTSGYHATFTGYVTLYDGQVNLGTYPLDGGVSTTVQRIPFVTSERLVTFYQDKPSYKIELTLHRYMPPQTGGKMYYNFWEQLNRASPGARPFPRLR